MLKDILNIFSKKKPSEINRRISEKLHDMPFKYISEKDINGEETIIGRNGHINIEGNKREYLCGTVGVKTIFKADICEMQIWEFMSLDGCVINFVDVNTKLSRSINVYYDKHLT